VPFIPGLIISIPFLVATFLVYALIPELQNMFGKCLMLSVAGMIVYSITLSVVSLLPITNDGCLVLGFITYFAIMLSFFWVNVMCFDIWLTFRGIRIASEEKKQFFYYICYGIGGPVIMLTFFAIVESTDLNWRPKIGAGEWFIPSKICR
jgi:G protein-coupled receptor Mth (Methuselah protein)